MACTYLICDGFGYGTPNPWKSVDYSGTSGVQAGGHTDTYGVRQRYVDSWFRYEIISTPDNISVGVWVYPMDSYNIDDSIWLRAKLSSGEYIDARWDSANHTFDAYVDGVKVADGGESVDNNDWFHFEFYLFIDDAGFIKTRIDGVADIDYSGDTLPAAASAEVEYVYFWSRQSNYNWWDDIMIGIDDFTGDIRVDYIVPTADTAVDDWTPTAGDSYQCVDEKPANDADYIYTDINTDETELDMAAWPETNKTPVLVDAMARSQEDTATAESLKLGVDSGGVDDTTEFQLSTSWIHYHHYMAQNPDGPVAWDDAAIEALKLRVEAVI